MKNLPMRGHGILRGPESVPSSPQFEGRFGRLFRALPPARFEEQDLKKLAAAIRATFADWLLGPPGSASAGRALLRRARLKEDTAFPKPLSVTRTEDIVA